MIKVLTAAQMRACDRAAIDEHGIPGLVLMENAGIGVLGAMTEHFGGQPPLSTAVLCGKGNNGGDGFVVARHLQDLGGEVVCYLFGELDGLAGDAAANAAMAAAGGVPIHEANEAGKWADLAAGLGRFDCLLDAMLGTGLQSAARGVIADAIESMNAAAVPVVAVDLPSGLSADTGAVLGPTVLADLTVTFGAPKCCHVLEPAAGYCGDLEVVDISIPTSVIESTEPALELVTPQDLPGVIPERRRDSHKGSFGRVLVIGGAPGTAGAAVLAARGALRGGAGLVHIACPDPVCPLVGGQITEALVHSVPAEASGGIGIEANAVLAQLVARADVVALGPGIGTAEETRTMVQALATTVERPMVIDADGLNALAGSLDSLTGAPAARVLTPHPGEAARLLKSTIDAVQGDRPAAARELAERSGAVVVLKGYYSLIAAPGAAPLVNPTGNPGMATGGTGDVLTGLIAALVGQGMEPLVAAWAGAYLHGLAGDLAAEEMGEISMIAGDLVHLLPEAFLAAATGEPR